MRERREISAIVVALLIALAPNAARADMLSGLRDSTLGCGMDFFYFS